MDEIKFKIKYFHVFHYSNESQGECVLLFDSPNMVVTERKQKKRVKGKRGYVLDSFATLSNITNLFIISIYLITVF